MSPSRLCALLATANFLAYFDRYLISAILPEMQRTFGLSHTQGGFLVSSFVVGYMIASPVFGIVGDRLGRKVVLVFGCAWWSVATLLTAFAPSFPALLAVRLAVGLGEATIAANAPAVLRETNLGSSKLTGLLAWYNISVPLGLAGAFILGGALAHVVGWRSLFTGASLAGLPVCLLLLRSGAFGVRPAMSAARKPRWAAEIAESARALAGAPLFWRMTGGFTAANFMLAGIGAWGAPFIAAAYRWDEGATAKWFGLAIAASSVAAFTYAGAFARRPTGVSHAERWAAFAYRHGVVAAICMTVGLLPTNAPVALSALALAVMASFAAVPGVMAVALEAVPARSSGAASAVIFLCIQALGALPAPILVGWLADRFGVDRAMWVLPAVAVLAPLLWKTRPARRPAVKIAHEQGEARSEAKMSS